MEIRAAKPEDVPAVLPMVGKIAALHEKWDPAKYGYLAGVEGMYSGWLRNRAVDPRSVFLVAEREGAGGGPGRLVGFLVGEVEQEIPIYRVEEFGWIHDLWVEEEYRNEGLARQMVTLAVEKFAEIGVVQVRLDTAAKNEAARKLFESCGFRVSAVEMVAEVGRGNESATDGAQMDTDGRETRSPKPEGRRNDEGRMGE